MKELKDFINESYSKDDIIFYIDEIKSCIKKLKSNNPEKIKKELEDNCSAYIQDFDFLEMTPELKKNILHNYMSNINPFFAMKWSSSNINQKTVDYINATVNGTINKDLKCLCRFELIKKEPIFYLYISE